MANMLLKAHVHAEFKLLTFNKAMPVYDPDGKKMKYFCNKVAKYYNGVDN